MAGKGDNPRSYNKLKFDENYSQINWTKKNQKTSEGTEYTLLVEDPPPEEGGYLSQRIDELYGWLGSEDEKG